MSLNIANIPNYNNIEKNNILITNISIDKIENTINNILDKYNELCKYYINYNECYWSVSFNVDLDQFEEMCKTAFEIKLFKGLLNNAIIEISNEINENNYWIELCRDLKKLKLN